jgi:hypothetical protein
MLLLLLLLREFHCRTRLGGCAFSNCNNKIREKPIALVAGGEGGSKGARNSGPKKCRTTGKGRPLLVRNDGAKINAAKRDFFWLDQMTTGADKLLLPSVPGNALLKECSNSDDYQQTTRKQ